MLATQPPRANRLLCALTWPGIPSCHCSLPHPMAQYRVQCQFRLHFEKQFQYASEPHRAQRERERERKTDTENRNAQRFFNCHVLRVVAGACGVTSPCLAAKCGIITQPRDRRVRTLGQRDAANAND